MRHFSKGVKGQKCDRPLISGESVCLSNPCWNGGTCEEIESGYRCNCFEGFLGKDCRTIQSSPCTENNPCKNGAICKIINQNGQLIPTCICTADWTGKYCDTEIGLCDKPNPCFNGGTCIENLCRCPQNYSGLQCQTYNPLSTDRIVRVLSKGWYVTKITLNYEVPNDTEKIKVSQSAQLLLGQTKIFKIPNSVNYNGDYGVTLLIDISLYSQQIKVRMNGSPECVDLWGTVFAPRWSKVNC